MAYPTAITRTKARFHGGLAPDDDIYDAILDQVGNLTDSIRLLTASLDTGDAAIVALGNEMRTDHATFKTAVNDLVARVNQQITHLNRPRVAGNITAGLQVDANANDIEMTAAVSVFYKGLEFPFAIEDPIDTSTKTINTRTIATSRADAGWVFADLATGLTQMDQSITANTVTTTALGGLARYSMATTTLPPTATCVPIGVVSLLEGGSGTFTWGPDSITAETEVYYSFRGLPGVVTAAASFAATGGATATFAYGAGVCRLGTGTVVSYTGKTGVAFDTVHATNVPTAKTGVWFLYLLADDSEVAMQFGGAGYDTLALAQAAVRDHNPNPLLPIIGIIYVQNASGADFVPGTTNLNVAGLTNTFTIVSNGSSWVEMGRGVGGQPFAALTNDAPDTLAAAALSARAYDTNVTASAIATAPVTITVGKTGL